MLCCRLTTYRHRFARAAPAPRAKRNDQESRFKRIVDVYVYCPSKCFDGRRDARPPSTLYLRSAGATRGSDNAAGCLTLLGPAAAKRQPSGAPATQGHNVRQAAGRLSTHIVKPVRRACARGSKFGQADRTPRSHCM